MSSIYLVVFVVYVYRKGGYRDLFIAFWRTTPLLPSLLLLSSPPLTSLPLPSLDASSLSVCVQVT